MREIILDTETTGLDPSKGHRVVDIGCVEIINRIKTGREFQVYINPEMDMPDQAFRIHGLSTNFLSSKKKFAEVAEEFVNFIGQDKLIIHNARFDVNFINSEFDRIGLAKIGMDRVLDTLGLAKQKFPGSPSSLDALCKRFGVSLSKRDKHGALLDAQLLADVYLHLSGGAQGIINFSYSSINKTTSEVKLEKKLIERRNFILTSEEEAAHLDLLASIKAENW